MALRLRRGTDAERLAITPAEGELVYTTDTKKVYIGDGSTLGGNIIDTTIIGLNDLSDVSTAGVADNQILKYNSDNSRFEPVNISQVNEGATSLDELDDVDLTSNPVGAGAVLVNDGTNYVPTAKTSLLSLEDLTGVFGVSNPNFGDVLTYDGFNFTAQSPSDTFLEQQNYKINIVADDSTIMVNTDDGTFEGDLTGDVVGDLIGDVTGDVTGDVVGNLIGNAIGNHSGTFDGDVTGSVFGDDSTMIINGVTSKVSAIEVESSGRIRSEGIQLSGGAFPNLIQTHDDTVTSMVLSTANTSGVVQSLRNVQVGGANVTSNPDATLTTYTSTTQGAAVMVYHSVEGDGGAAYTFLRSRGTKAAPTLVQSGDNLGAYTATGWNGGGFKSAGGLRIISAGTVEANRVPANIELFTTDAAGAPEVGLSVHADTLTTEFSGAAQLASYADDAARDAAITSPVAGMMVFNATGTKFQGYTGAAWVDLN